MAHDEVILNQGGAFQIKQAAISCTGSDTTQIVAAVSKKKIRVIGVMIQPLAAEATLTWKSATTGLAPAATWKAGSGWSDYWGPWGWFFETLAGQALNLTHTAACGGWVNYIEVPA